MAKPRIPNQKKQYQLLNRRLAAYMAAVRRIYGELNSEAARIALSTGYDGKQPFAWKDYPATKARVRKLQERFVSQLGGLIMTGTSDEWKRSNLQQDLIVDKVLKAYHTSREDAANERYYRDNSEALQAFQQRKEHGMNLSDKLWDQSQAYREELQDTISAAIERGTDAITLSKQISKYLSDFPAMQRDYKEKYGKASKVQNCEYRSIRLARSEINMAYRSAEQQRWRQLDFVVGYEIKMSGSHPVHDVCDELAGKYPKDFVWNGWHPNCMCYEIPILKTEDEFYSDDDKPSVNEVTDVPDSFKAWCEDNEARISLAQEHDTLPYFLRDNKEYVDAVISKPKPKDRNGIMSKEEIKLVEDLEGAIKDIPRTSYGRDIRARVFILRGFLAHENYADYHDMVMDQEKNGTFAKVIKSLKKGDYKEADSLLTRLDTDIANTTRFHAEKYIDIPRRNPKIKGVNIDYSESNDMLGSYGSVYRFIRDTGFDDYDQLYEFFGGRDALESEIKRLADGSSMYTAISGDTLYKDIILGDGRIKNSLETKTGTFKIIGDERAVKERHMFGLDPEADMITLPKYGFFATPGDMDYEKIVGWGYGDCYVEYKPYMKARASMTFGDSFDGNMVDVRNGYYSRSAPAVSVSHPDAEFILSRQHAIYNLTPEKLQNARTFSELNTFTYTEAQIYGDVTMDDVQCIYAEGKKNMRRLQKALEKRGLAIEVKPARFDARLKYLEAPDKYKDGEIYAYSLLPSDVDALGDYYVNCLCEVFADPIEFDSRSPVEFESYFANTSKSIRRREASIEEKREFLKRFYQELDKKEKGSFSERWWTNRKKTYGGWTSDVIHEDLLKRSK